MSILWSLPGMLRQIFAFIDTIAFGLIDQAYNLIDEFSKASFFNHDIVSQLRNNMYVIIGIFALFRLALILINSIINPDKLTEKGNGIGNVLFNIIVMFILLVAVPIVFNEAFNLQQTIVEGNYVQKIFVDSNKLKTIKNPGKQMQHIAIGSLVTLNEEIDDCDSECQEAVDAYKDMETQGFTMPKISHFVDNRGEDAKGEKVFVYDYMIIVTFAAGVFITYILFSFAIDIAVRMVELTVLQIIAPLFIVSYIDPKSAKSGPFHKWLTTVGKTYASLFIKLAIVAIMLVLINLINDVDLSGGIAKLLLLFAILIFAKKAPKWLGDMLGVETGLDGLGIGKKLAGAALIGGGLTKLGHAAVGAGLTAARSAHSLRKASKVGLKEKDDRAFDRFKKEYKAQRASSGRASSLGNALKEGYFNKNAIKQNWDNWKNTAGAGLSGVSKGAVSGVVSGWSAKDMKDVAAKAKVNAQTEFDKYAPGYRKTGDRLKDWIDNKNDKFAGKIFNENELKDRKEEADGVQKASERYGKVLRDENGKRSKKLCPIKTSEASNLMDEYKEFDRTTEDGISSALIKERLKAGIKIEGASLDEGRNLKLADGLSASDCCLKNGVYNQYGLQEVKSMAKEMAYKNASDYVENQAKISEANKAATAANSQAIEIKGNLTASLNKNAMDAVTNVESAFAAQAKATRNLSAAIEDYEKAPADEKANKQLVVDNMKRALDTANEGLAAAKKDARDMESMDVGALDSYLIAMETRNESIRTSNILKVQNDRLEKEIQDSIENSGNKSGYMPKDPTTGKQVQFLADPTQNQYVVTLMNGAKEKAKSDASELKPKKKSE